MIFCRIWIRITNLYPDPAVGLQMLTKVNDDFREIHNKNFAKIVEYFDKNLAILVDKNAEITFWKDEGGELACFLV